jgi:dolichyl-phosphate beta-glucosyltransferase
VAPDRVRYSCLVKDDAVATGADVKAANGQALPSVRLSLVIPAFNEARRIATTLETAGSYLASLPFPTELILVDDGSDDATAAIARTSTSPTRVLAIPHGGKAAALRAGLSAATGDLVAFTDADLATPLSNLDHFVVRASDGADVVIGSREGVGAHRLGEPTYRHVMGRVFNRLVQLLLLPGLDDTQCGFKLFTRDAVRLLLDRSILYRDTPVVTGARVTAFDVELLTIARRRGLRIDVVPVVWTYGEGSKVSPLRDTWANLRDVVTVARAARSGRYDGPPST